MKTFTLNTTKDIQKFCEQTAEAFQVSPKFKAKDCEVLFTFLISGLKRSGMNQKDIYKVCRDVITDKR